MKTSAAQPYVFPSFVCGESVLMRCLDRQGPMLIGTLLGLCLAGVITVQSYVYLTTYQKCVLDHHLFVDPSNVRECLDATRHG